ncbi:MAG: adenylate kinase [Asgard group archaeon]|nr:adenylate kinase [Asgard group archaeon]
METQGKIAIVGGVPGVGKTTVIKHVLNYAKEEGFEISILVYGTVMMEIAKSDYNIQSRDDLRKQTPAIQKEIQKRAGMRIAERARGKVVIVDTHYTIKIGSGSFLQGIPQWVSDVLHPSILILIETIPEEIVQRRNVDDSRVRDEDSVSVLFEHQLINKTVASTICQKSGALLAVIKNKQGKAKAAGKELYDYLKSL